MRPIRPPEPLSTRSKKCTSVLLWMLSALSVMRRRERRKGMRPPVRFTNSGRSSEVSIQVLNLRKCHAGSGRSVVLDVVAFVVFVVGTRVLLCVGSSPCTIIHNCTSANRMKRMDILQGQIDVLTHIQQIAVECLPVDCFWFMISFDSE